MCVCVVKYCGNRAGGGMAMDLWMLYVGMVSWRPWLQDGLKWMGTGQERKNDSRR